jgi:hypothetical protein
MTTKPLYPRAQPWGCRVLLGLLMTLTVCTGAWPQARMRGVENASLRPLGAQVHVTVKEGSLSVYLREAPVQEVLAMIGQQAGLHVRSDAAATHLVSAEFTTMALDQGLRRLLRGASLSYALRYTRGPAETAVLHEVRVFDETRREELADQGQVSIQRAERAPARLTPSAQEQRADLPPAEPEPEVDAVAEPESTEPAADADIPEN